MISFTTPDGTQRVTISDGVTVREPVQQWRARVTAMLKASLPVHEVPTDQLWRYVGRDVKYGHDGDDTWSPLVAVRQSRFQGAEIVLEACVLQSCFADSPYQVR